MRVTDRIAGSPTWADVATTASLLPRVAPFADFPLARPLAGQRWMCFSTFPVSSQSLFTAGDLARDSADAERSGTGC